MFAAKVPGQHVMLPYEARAMLMWLEIFSALNKWGAAKRLDRPEPPTEEELTEYYVLNSAYDPENLTHQSGAEAFAGFFPAPQTKEEQTRAFEAFMINM